LGGQDLYNKRKDNQMKKVIDLLITTTIQLGEVDEYRNNMGVLLIKAIFGALRPFWPHAYNSCHSGDDFNVPELVDSFGAVDTRHFTDKQLGFISLFCERVAHHLGYYDADYDE